MLHTSSLVHVHRAKRLRPPGSETDVDIDELMVPLVEAIWAHGLATEGSCQDLAESVLGGNYTMYPQVGDGKGHADLYRGLAWLKLPRTDGLRLLELLATDRTLAQRMRWLGEPGAWSCFSQIRTDDEGVLQLGQTVEIQFPARQIEHVVNVLKRDNGDRE